MIINTGMRTDIPAFYSRWFLNRLSEGCVMVRNPYRPEQITRYELTPEVVDCIAFCTKNPAPMLGELGRLSAYNQYWFVTITPYGRDIEPGVPSKEKVTEDFIALSKAIGKERVGWRCDPILINDTYTLERHIRDFEQMCAALAGSTEVCVISFIDLYEKVKRNFPEVRALTRSERISITEAFARTASHYGIKLKACAEGDGLERYGADCSGCMTKETLERVIGSELKIPSKPSPRPQCRCVLGNDIGAYNTCGHMCRYCYANSDYESVRRNMRLHDPESPLLIGRPGKDDIIHQAKQQSWTDGQLKLF